MIYLTQFEPCWQTVSHLKIINVPVYPQIFRQEKSISLILKFWHEDPIIVTMNYNWRENYQHFSSKANLILPKYISHSHSNLALAKKWKCWCPMILWSPIWYYWQFSVDFYSNWVLSVKFLGESYKKGEPNQIYAGETLLMTGEVSEAWLHTIPWWVFSVQGLCSVAAGEPDIACITDWQLWIQ